MSLIFLHKQSVILGSDFFVIFLRYLLATIAMEIFHKYDAPAASRIYPESCGLGFRNFWFVYYSHNCSVQSTPSLCLY